jgi:hypothetical protein
MAETPPPQGPRIPRTPSALGEGGRIQGAPRGVGITRVCAPPGCTPSLAPQLSGVAGPWQAAPTPQKSLAVPWTADKKGRITPGQRAGGRQDATVSHAALAEPASRDHLAFRVNTTPPCGACRRVGIEATLQALAVPHLAGPAGMVACRTWPSPTPLTRGLRAETVHATV